LSTKGTLRTCEKGHKYYKSTDCPTCPICEREKNPKAEFLSKIGAPARRAFERENILTLKKLSEYSEKEILNLHGVGPSAIRKLKGALETEGLTFRKEKSR
jgi:hypothetical protein